MTARASNGRWQPTTNVTRDLIGTNEGLQVGDLAVVLADGGEYICTAVLGPTSSTWVVEATGGLGDIIGPGASTDEGIARFDGVTGKLLQDSGVTIDDSDNIVGPANLTLDSPSPTAAFGDTTGSPTLLLSKGAAGKATFLAAFAAGSRYWDAFVDASEDIIWDRYIAGVFQDTPLTINNASGQVFVGALGGATHAIQGAGATVRDNQTDATNKNFLWRADPYTNAHGSWQWAAVSANIANNILRLGGHTANDSATRMEFYTAPALNSVGVQRGFFDIAGDFNVTNQLLQGGSIAADGVTGNADLVLGLVEAVDHGLTILSGPANASAVSHADVSGTMRGREQYDHNFDHMVWATAGADRMRLNSAGLRPITNGQVGLGVPASSVGFDNLTLGERAASPGNSAAVGVKWTRNDAPSTDMYTDDGGRDHPLSLMSPLHFGPEDFRLPVASAAAVVEDPTSFIQGLRFDDAVTQTAYKAIELPRNYSGNGLTVRVVWSDNLGAGGDLRINLAFERHNAGFDINAANFAALSFTEAGNGVVGQLNVSDFAFTNAQINGMLAGEAGRFRIQRLGGDALDTLNGAEVDVAHVHILENP